MHSSELAGFFHEDFFIPKLSSVDKEHVLGELVQPFLNTGKIKSRSLIMENLFKRETLGSTGIGKGVAIPHCRSLAVSEILIIVGISEEGVHYAAIDKKKVHLFFLIIAPPQEKSNLYLPILGKIVEIVRDSKKRRSLMKAENYTTFLKVITGD